MSLSHLALALLAIASSAAGQIFYKMTAIRISAADVASAGQSFFLLKLIQEYYFWIALAFYGLATLGWVYVLQHVALSRAYPLMALGYVIIPLLSLVMFQEPLSSRYFIGISFIIIGIVVIGLE